MADLLTFEGAITAIKAGKKVYRDGWGGHRKFIFQSSGHVFYPGQEDRTPANGVTVYATIDEKTMDGVVAPWVCNETDMNANDWRILPPMPQMPSVGDL